MTGSSIIVPTPREVMVKAAEAWEHYDDFMAAYECRTPRTVNYNGKEWFVTGYKFEHSSSHHSLTFTLQEAPAVVIT
jgi:hypothetical protein